MPRKVSFPAWGPIVLLCLVIAALASERSEGRSERSEGRRVRSERREGRRVRSEREDSISHSSLLSPISSTCEGCVNEDSPISHSSLLSPISSTCEGCENEDSPNSHSSLLSPISSTGEGSANEDPLISHSSLLSPISSIRVFFSRTHSGNEPLAREDTESIDRYAAAFIDSARNTIDCAFYELESPRIARALIAAHRRGVRVRLVGDSDHRENQDAIAVEAAGIPVVWDDRSALMHNKFIVADGAEVWTGSYNFTDNCTFRNNNNAVAIRSQELAENYTAEFEEMFVRHQFGARSPSQTPHTKVTVEGTDIYNWFSPEDDVRSKVVRYVRAARSSIKVLAFSFSDDEIAEALLERRRAGVAVDGVFESRGSDAKHSDLARLNAGGARILPDGNRYVMHHKVMIIDDLWTITGSYNFTQSAAESNDENLIVIKSPEVAAQFAEEFGRITAASRAPAAAAD